MAEGFNLIFTKANFLFMMNGLLMTILISIGTIFLSMIFGTILALLRHFCTGKWAWLSGLTGVYIEFFRCTPNILSSLRYSGLNCGFASIKPPSTINDCPVV